MENGKPRKRRQLSPAEKWEVFLEVTSQQLTQADAARKWNVDVSTVIRIRQLAKDAALAAFAAAKPGRMPSPEQVELEAALAENDRLSEALKELAVELSLHRGLSTAPGYLTSGLVACSGVGSGSRVRQIIRGGRGRRSRRRWVGIGRVGCRSGWCVRSPAA